MLSSADTRGARVLIVDDSPAIRALLARMLRRLSFEAVEAGNGAEASELLEEHDVELVISDVNMPEMDGIALLELVRRRDPDIPFVLVTGLPSLETAIKAVEHGALRYLVKPFDQEELERVVTRAVQLHRLARLKRRALELLGRSRSESDTEDLNQRLDLALSTMAMAFQPMLGTASRQAEAFEALLRVDPEAFDGPAAALEASEELGRVTEVSRKVRDAIAAVAPSRPPGSLLFVNMHTTDLLDGRLTGGQEPLAEFADHVVLEITERHALTSISDVRERVADLRDQGYRIAVDDLGAGYAGLSSFATLEPDFVKIDMSLVRGIHSDRVRQQLVRSMSSLCRQMGIAVVAEGVETVEERDMLAELGCDYLQGYLFARPGPPFPTASWEP